MTKPSSASGVTFRSIDDLFEPTDGSSEKGTLTELPVDSLIPFEKHPFREYPEEQMQEMVESVSQYGVLMPILVRPHKAGEGYEIISGHNRVEACKRAGIEKIPATVRELDDDTAIILMVDSNLRQRDKLLPSEKAKAFQMKMEALKRQGQRRDLTSSQLGTKLGVRADQLIAEQAGESRNQIQRYIRLNSLTPSLLDCVDNGDLAFNPAVEISYLDPADQEIVFETIDCYKVSPSVAQAQNLRKKAKAGTLTEEKMSVPQRFFECFVSRCNCFFPGLKQSLAEYLIQRVTPADAAFMLIKHDHMFLELHVFIPVLRFFPRTLHEVPTPRLLLLQFIFPSFCSFDIAFHLSCADTAYIERAVIRVHHMMHVADYLIAAHFADGRGLAEVGHTDAGPAGVRKRRRASRGSHCRQASFSARRSLSQACPALPAVRRHRRYRHPVFLSVPV